MERKVWTVSDKQGGRKVRKVTDRVTEKVTDKVIENLDDKSLKILQLLVEDPGYTTVILSKKLSLNRKTISERIRTLRNNKIIERVGSARNGYWKVTIGR